jgi:hypothetical protein
MVSDMNQHNSHRIDNDYEILHVKRRSTHCCQMSTSYTFIKLSPATTAVKTLIGCDVRRNSSLIGRLNSAHLHSLSYRLHVFVQRGELLDEQLDEGLDNAVVQPFIHSLTLQEIFCTPDIIGYPNGCIVYKGLTVAK